MGSSFLHYNLQKKIGQGGMGVVYLANDTRLNRRVALKFLPKEISKDPSKHDRFRIEAQAAAGLNHPNIAQVHAIEEANGELCIVLEYIEGRELKDLVESNTLDLERKINIASDIAEGLRAAHQKGIIHRDIKSRNIMVDSTNRVKIMDFGLARLEGSDQPNNSDSTAGTTAYMSPEQLQGKDADARSDIWSYGVVLYELFTGKLPFRGMHEAAIMYSITEENPLPIETGDNGIPEFIRKIIERCLEKKPDDRYQELKMVLEDLRDGRAALDLSESDEQTGLIYRKKNSVITMVVAAVVIAFVFFWWGNDFLLMGNVPQKKYLAVLPIENVSGNSELDMISAGLTETLSYRLSKLEQYEDEFFVTPASEIRNADVLTASMANEIFGVNLAISSTIQTVGDSTRLIIQLIDAENIVSVDSDQVTVHSHNLLQLQNESVQVMLKMLRIEIQPVMVETISKGEPANPDAFEFYLKGRANLPEQANLDMLETAIQYFNEALSADPQFTLALAGLGEAYWRTYIITQNIERVEQARQALQKAQSIDSNLPTLQFLMGLIEDGEGNHDDAIHYFERALKLDPRYTEAKRLLASVYGTIGEHQKARKIFNEIIEEEPESIIGYNALGIYNLEQGNWEQAVENFEQVVEITPKNSAAYSNLGYAHYYKGDQMKARQLFERSLEIDGNPVTAYNLATLYYAEKMYAEATDMYKTILDNERYKGRHNFWAGYAAAVENSQGIDQAKELYIRAIEEAENQLQINPDDVSILSNIAVYHSEIMNEDEALGYVEKVLALEQENPDILLQIVTAYENLGMREEALRWIREEHIPSIESLPEFKSLADDSKFIQLKDDQLNSGNQ